MLSIPAMTSQDSSDMLAVPAMTAAAPATVTHTLCHHVSHSYRQCFLIHSNSVEAEMNE